MKNNSNLKWFALEITAGSAAAEAVEFALNELEALGTEINNLGKKATETLVVVGVHLLPFVWLCFGGRTAPFRLGEGLKGFGLVTGAGYNSTPLTPSRLLAPLPCFSPRRPPVP